MYKSKTTLVALLLVIVGITSFLFVLNGDQPDG